MSVKQVSKGNWRVRVRTGDTGQHSKSGFSTKELALKYEREFLSRRDRGEELDVAGGKLTFKKYAEAWREIQAHRPGTAKNAESHLRLHIYPTFGDRRLSTIRPSEIQAWYSKLTLAPSTRKVAYATLAGVFKAAVRDRLIVVSPCQLRLSSKRTGAPIVALSVGQVDAIIGKLPERYQAAAYLAANSGLRISEVFGVTVDRLNFLRREVKVDRQLVRRNCGDGLLAEPKTEAAHRTVPLTDDVVKVVAAHIEKFGTGPEGLIFTSPSGDRANVGVVAKMFVQARAAAKAPSWATFHDLRHHYASVLIAEGVSIKKIQRLMGHESAAMTLDVYGHLMDDDDDQVREAIERARGAA